MRLLVRLPACPALIFKILTLVALRFAIPLRGWVGMSRGSGCFLGRDGVMAVGAALTGLSELRILNLRCGVPEFDSGF